MKYIILITFFLGINILHLSAVEKLDFYKGKTVTINGSFSKGEWDDASAVSLKVSGNNAVNIFYKHDGNNLLFAFCKNLKIGKYQFRFPEILFDINNTKTGAWDSNDHWFHVSATDCNSKGVPKDYSNCLEVQPDWLAEKNFMDPTFNDTVEISIPFTKLGIDPKQNKIFGIAFDVTDTQTFWNFYPQSATMNYPSTWADAEVITDGSGINNEDRGEILIYPNPANSYIEIRKPAESSVISIYNSLGECVISNETAQGAATSERINVSELQSGLYYCTFPGGINNPVESFVIVR